MQKRYPFKYLDAYTRDDKDFYFGRDEEVKQLYEMTFQSNLLLVYGASGTGKTSLIHCGLANCFETHNWLALTIRRSADINHSFEKVINDAIGSDIEYFSRKRNTEDEADHLPLAIKLKALRLKYFKPIYLIFDQFEELYILGKSDEQSQFYQIIKQLLTLNQPIKIIIVIREEYLGHLYYFEQVVPDILRKKLRVEPMSRENVKNVLEGISKNSLVSVKRGEEDIFTDKIFEILDTNKKGMDLPCLQILFDKLYQKNTQNDTSYSSNAEFNIEELEKLGDLGDILLDLLRSLVVECEEKYKIETKNIWSILTQLTTSQRTKQSRSKAEICEKISNIESVDITNVLSFFEKKQILRNKGREDYEFRHDALADRVYKSKETKIKIEEQIQRKLEDKVHFEESFLNDIERNESQLNITNEQQQWIEESWRELKRKHNQELKIKRASLKNVLTLLGRSLLDNSKDFGEMSNIGLNMSEYFVKSNEPKYFQHISEENITSLTQLFTDVSKANLINFSFSNDTYGKPCCTKDGIYRFSVKIEKKNIVEIRFFNETKEKTLTRSGFWGIDMEYDSSDNEIKRTYIGLDGKPALTTDGYACIKTAYDKYDNPTYIRYFDENDKKKLHRDGNYGYKSRFDKEGNEIQRTFLDKDDKPTSIYNNVSSVRFEYENGLVKYKSFHDENDKPCYDCFDYHAIQYQYDDKGREIKGTYCNTERYPMISKDGYVSTESIYDENNLPVINKYLDFDGNITHDNSMCKGVRIEYDENDRVISIEYIDEFGNYISNYENVSKMIFEYNTIGQIICQKYLGHNQNPTYYPPIGYSVKLEYDDRGLPMRMFFYDIHGNPTYNQNSVHGYLFEYNADGQKIKRASVDFSIQLTNDIEGNCIEEYHTNADGKEIVYCYDSDNNLTELLLIKRDRRDNIIFNANLNKDKHIIPNEAGIYITKMKYDKYDNIIQALYFDADENLLMDSMGNFGVDKEYSGNNILVAECSLDKFYNAHLNNQGYAIIRYECDKNGIQNGLSYYDADGKPILCKDGYHRRTWERNDQERRFYGCDLKPCNNIWGFSIYLSEKTNDIETESYWDVSEKPAIDIRLGWHKKTIKNIGDKKITEFLDINEQPIECKDNTIEKITYKEPLINDNYISIEYFDKNGKKVNDENGNHKYIYDYEGRELKYTFDNKGKKKVDNINLSIGEKILKTLRYSLILLIPFLAIYLLFLPIIKWIKTKFKKKEPGNNYPISYCIQVVEVFSIINGKVTMARSLGIEDGDLIYAYNDWRYEDYDKSDYKLVEKFKEESNRCMEIPKTITFKRWNNAESRMSSPFTVDFPKGVMEMSIQDINLHINPDML